MSINASMIAENERADEELIRANLALFITAQENETQRCRCLTGIPAGGPSAMEDTPVSMQ